MNATEFLEQVKDADAKIDSKRAEERELWSLATSMAQSNEGMPTGTSDPDKMTNIVQKIIDAQKRTNAAIDRYIDIRENVIQHIEKLPTKQYQTLHWLYVRKREYRTKGQAWYYTWREVAENLGCSEENIRKNRRRAIKNLQKILDSEQRLLEVE